MARLLLTLSIVIGCSTLARAADPPSEEQKIEVLLKHVAELTNATFVRNDVEYDAEAAAKFLRGKWDWKKDEVKTAIGFIEKIASGSSTTGKPYLIRFNDGTEVKSGDHLREQLKKLEQPSEDGP